MRQREGKAFLRRRQFSQTAQVRSGRRAFRAAESVSAKAEAEDAELQLWLKRSSEEQCYRVGSRAEAMLAMAMARDLLAGPEEPIEGLNPGSTWTLNCPMGGEALFSVHCFLCEQEPGLKHDFPSSAIWALLGTTLVCVLGWGSACALWGV